MKKISKLIALMLLLINCSTVENMKDSTVEAMDKIVPVDLNGKDESVFGTKDYADAIVSQLMAKWFKTDERFKLSLSNGDAASHLFYDVKPDINLDAKTVNFVLTTPQGSDKLYGIDISSGQRYVDKVLCEQSDMRKKFKGKLYRTPFNLGIIPRTLDQLGTPQKILVFGDNDYFRKNYKTNFFDARVIGGFIEKFCSVGACSRYSDLTSRVVVVGVQKGSEKYENVKRIEDLRLLVDWEEVRAFVENNFGMNEVAGKHYPAYRVAAELSAIQTMSSLKKQSFYLSNKELNKMRNSCYKLYDYVWKEVGQKSSVEEKLSQAKSYDERKKILTSTRGLKDRFFYSRFINSFRRFGDEYNTCARFVYPSNIQYDAKRHWFMTHYSAIHLLNSLGYKYDCKRTLWLKNTILSNGKRSTPMREEFKNCSARAIDKAFEYAITFLQNLRLKGYTSYRYIDYDGHSFGTHNKIYSWVYQENKQLYCAAGQEDFVRKLSNFPKDISWSRWAPLYRTRGGK